MFKVSHDNWSTAKERKEKKWEKSLFVILFLGLYKVLVSIVKCNQRPSRCESFEVKFMLPLIAAIGSMCGLTSLKKELN